MAFTAKHHFVSPKDDGGDKSLVKPSDWNAEHDLFSSSGVVLGRKALKTGTPIPPTDSGQVEELPIAVSAGPDGSGQAMRPPIGPTTQRPKPPADGMLRFNTTTGRMEGYQGSAWVNWGTVIINDTAPTDPQKGDIWCSVKSNTFAICTKVANRTVTPAIEAVWTIPYVGVVIDAFAGDGHKVDFDLSLDVSNEKNLSVFYGSDYVPKTSYYVTAAIPAVEEDNTTTPPTKAQPKVPAKLTFTGFIPQKPPDGAPINPDATPPDVGKATNIEVEYLSAGSQATPADDSVTTAKIKNGAVTNSKLGGLAVGTGKIADKAVTYPKIQNVTQGGVVLGRRSNAGVGSITEISYADLLYDLGGSNGYLGQANIPSSDAPDHYEFYNIPGIASEVTVSFYDFGTVAGKNLVLILGDAGKWHEGAANEYTSRAVSSSGAVLSPPAITGVYGFVLHPTVGTGNPKISGTVKLTRMSSDFQYHIGGSLELATISPSWSVVAVSGRIKLDSALTRLRVFSGNTSDGFTGAGGQVNASWS